MDTTTTEVIATTTTAQMITILTTKSNLTCVPSSLFLYNEPFYLNSPGGESLATWSTVILFFHILLSVLMYNGRSCCKKRDRIQIFITRRQKITSLLYWFSMGMFEIVSIYGASMREDSANLNAPMTFFNVLLWCILNTYSVILLLLGFFSKETFRLYMWAAITIQLPFFGYLIVERMIRKAIEADLLITGLLFVLCAFHVVDVPGVFRITSKLTEYYIREVADFSTTKNIIVPLNTDYLTQELDKDARNIQD